MSAEMNTQVALVTGASRGIGRAIALELAKRGVTVLGTATTESGAQGISEALQGFGASRGLVLNVTDAAAVDAALDSIFKEFGGLHILVNNAGITRDNLAMR
ncbi:MAG: SDR family NAD(P)-dependent oxidoreductase, partial [Burkholderiales bacterium]|nr:SDR family NAD(P)-dependent oxidoreductase [Burkholderiales bacterium]